MPRKRKPKLKGPEPGLSVDELGFFPEAGPGCNLSLLYRDNAGVTVPKPAWTIGNLEPFDEKDLFGSDSGEESGSWHTDSEQGEEKEDPPSESGEDQVLIKIPDVNVDPEEFLVTLYNPSDDAKAFHISSKNKLMDAQGRPLSSASWSCCLDTCCGSRAGFEAGDVTTLVALIPGRSTVDLCRAAVESIEEIDMHSDVVIWKPDVDLMGAEDTVAARIARVMTDGPAAMSGPATVPPPARVIVFPLAPSESSEESSGSRAKWLCTQSAGGALTHFSHMSTWHAVDLRCDVGTLVVAGDSGVVATVRDHHSASGPHVNNLFKWNGVVIHTDDGGSIEYIHIRTGSARVSVGDRVVAGQVLCEAGGVGFCPEPHLHVQVHLERHDQAPSVPFRCRNVTQGQGVDTFGPLKAGRWYSKYGEEEV